MPFTNEQNIFILETYFRSWHDEKGDGNWKYSFQSCAQQFLAKYPEKLITYDIFAQHVRRLVTRFRETGSICRRKSVRRPKLTKKSNKTYLTEKPEATFNLDVNPIKQEIRSSDSSDSDFEMNEDSKVKLEIKSSPSPEFEFVDVQTAPTPPVEETEPSHRHYLILITNNNPPNI